MSPLLQAYDALMPSPTCEESGLKEHNYFGASECSSVDSSTIGAILSLSEDSKDCLNLKATELRLGLPGSQSPERNRDSNLCLSRSSKLNANEKPLVPCSPVKDGLSSTSQRAAVSGTKIGFSDTVQDFVQKPPSEANWTFESYGSGRDSDTQKPGAETKLPMNGSANLMLSSSRRNSGSESFGAKDQLVVSQAITKVLQELPPSDSNNSASATKAQVVGWPPIRSYRKNTLATSSRNTNPLFVKVSMDGAPYLGKVDLGTYTSYKELSLGLEKMFSSFTLGRCESHGASGGQNMSRTKLKDLVHGSEYMLTYEDRDRDWMLVGDVPWDSESHGEIKDHIIAIADVCGQAIQQMCTLNQKNF